MSVIFGVRRPVGQVTDPQEILDFAVPTKHYAPVGTFFHVLDRVGMGFQPFHTAERSWSDRQPSLDSQGNMLVLDGRLDNHDELRSLLEIDDPDLPDSSLILAAFARWGASCFARLIGDWALSLWSSTEHLLYLARDHAGTRTLFFQNANGTLRWSTYLDSFFPEGSSRAVDEEYAARFLASLPVRDLTPYKGIRAVPAAHYLVVRDNRVTRVPHWNWTPADKIHYHSDAEYEAHFFSLFRSAVQRRTNLGEPILAQLSGGMDSTSIVCMSDHIRRSQDPHANLVDTVSFYDDSEPNWDERPYFSTVEALRQKTGIHIQASFMGRTFEPPDPTQGSYLFPGADSNSIKREQAFHNLVDALHYRVILSGIGGDELLGGVPTPLPELADYLVSLNLTRLFRRAMLWCLANREPLIHMLFKTMTFTIGLYRQPHGSMKTISPWLQPRLQTICRDLEQRNATGRSLGLAPSAINNGLTWWAIMETLPHLMPTVLERYEYRYPYLDRDLVDFLFRIPHEQLVRPGRRRSLMRRALKSIVPAEILERRRKAYVSRGPLVSLQRSREKIDALFTHSLAADYGFINPTKLRAAIDLRICGNEGKWSPSIMKAIAFELWLKANAASFFSEQHHLPAQVHARVTSSRHDPCTQSRPLAMLRGN